jgi:hypothetical protein
MDTPVSVQFSFDLSTDDGITLTGEGSMDGTLEYDRGDYWTPPHSDVQPDLRTCSFEAIWVDEDENEVEVVMEGKEAYSFLETYGWSYDMLELLDWEEVEYDYEEVEYDDED